MSSGTSRYGQLGMQMPTASVDPVTVDDLEKQRRNLQSLGMDDGWFGDVNKWRMDRIEGRDQMRDDLRARLLGGGGGDGPSGGDGASGMLKGLAKSAGKEMAKNAVSSAASGAASGAGMGALGAAL